MSRWDGGLDRSSADDRVAYGGFHKAASQRHLLLPALHAVQDAIGWVSHGAINYISERLTLGPAEAYGVATFYDLIATDEQPARVAHVCDDIACKAAGVDVMLDDLERELGPPRTDLDGVMWRPSPCLGQCDKGSAAFVQVAGGDHRVAAPASAKQIIEILRSPKPRDHVVAPTPRQVGAPTSLLARVGSQPTLDEYRADGGYEALTTALSKGSAWVVEQVVASGIKGRGGAAFPAGIKWKSVAAHDGTKYVVCNADESEPGTFKDRVLLENDPYLIIEALTIAGLAVGAERGYLYIRDEYPIALRAITEALSSVRAEGLLGEDILSSGRTFEIETRRGAGAYICGEETALFNSVEGYRPEPRQKPPFPTDAGLFGRPTLVNNVETLANIPGIIRKGGAAFATIGTDDSTGSKLFCVSGNVSEPGVFEVPFGATVRDLISLAGGPTSDIAAVLIGGAAGAFILPQDLDLALTFEATRERGIGLGSGVVIVFDSSVDFVEIVNRIAEFFGDESCGLCIPCRVGTVRQAESLVRLSSSNGDRTVELEILDELDRVLRDGSVCGLGQAASVAVQSALALGLIGDPA
ncbi:MAG: NAD(P)H-dependent oxidoreductase subunit E [Acidimicrobiia bacterium]|nr:NAD(P)H-dependent oxidoreductase subunit E [Acidimicrobiia bacterium]